MSFHAVWTELHGWLALPPSLIPNPDPAAPGPELAAVTDTLIGWMKWGGLVGAVGALIAAGIMMAIGRRNRNNMAVDAAVSLPWVVGGLALVLGSASLVGFFI